MGEAFSVSSCVPLPTPKHTDILLAMAEVGQLGLNSETLQRYVNTHIHGTCEEAPYHLRRQL